MSSPQQIPFEELQARLAEFRQLRSFVGGYLPVLNSNQWAEAFSAIPTVEVVNAYRCDMTDSAVITLAKLPKLKYLNLHKCARATKVGLEALANCRSLETLSLDEEVFAAGNYTLADVQKLQVALPKCRIIFAGGKSIPGLQPTTSGK